MNLLERFDLSADPLPPRPCPALVETLEGLLADARAGKLLAIGYARVDGEGNAQTTNYGWSGARYTRFAVAAGVLALQSAFGASLAGEDDA